MMPYIAAGAAALIGGVISARWNWWRKPTSAIPILMYHKIGTPPPESKLGKLWVSSEMLKKQMAYLSEQGYHPITFKDLYKNWEEGDKLPSKPVFITFDDGYENNFTEGFPILKNFGFRATIFVVVQTVGWENQWHDPSTETRIRMIAWPQLKILQKAGWEIGSHTMNHPRLPKLNYDDVKYELKKSRHIIREFLEEVPDTFAYPYGAGEDDEQIRTSVRNCGYKVALGVHAGKANLADIRQDPYGLPRIFVRGDENMFDFHLQMTRGRSRF